MFYSENIRKLFSVFTVLIIGTLSLAKIGVIDLHSVFYTAYIMVPAVVIIGLLGQKIGEILDNPRNRADADYKIAVLNALKRMDKSLTLEELNEKLSKTVTEQDAPDSEDIDEDMDV